jgi:tripartite-type tricarboxylate transporter receptor subunit TctC
LEENIINRRAFLKLTGIVASGLTLPGFDIAVTLWAKDYYPGKKIIWIVPVKPSNGLDTLVRFLSPHLVNAFKKLRPTSGGGIIIDNVPGAEGRKAYTNIFNASPDGYTFGDFNLGFITESITSQPPFDPRQFTFLLRTGASIRVIATRKEGFKNWQEMMHAARKQDVMWAAGNLGRATHIDSIIATKTMGIPAKLINFPGTAENINALIKGDAQVGLFYLDDIAALLKAGEFRLLMIFAEKSGYAGVPSVYELGYPDLAESIRYQRYLVGPPGIPPDIAEVISAAFQQVLAKKEIIAWGDRMHFPILPLYGEAAAKVARQVIDFYARMTPTLLKYLKL